jgi:hypothetical protein
MMLRNGPSNKEMNTMNVRFPKIQDIGAALAIFMTAGMAGGALAQVQAAENQPPTVQAAAAPTDTAAMSGVYGTMTTASMAMDAPPRAQMPRSAQNANTHQNDFPDNGFGKYWVGD